MDLSPHFKLYELTKSATASRFGIDNTPPPEIIPALKLLCTEILEPIRAMAGRPITPNSGYRCLELNRALGSKDTSQHVKGQAVDIEVPGVSNYDLAVWCRGNLEFDQLILEHYTPGVPGSGWVHISLKESGNRREVLTIGGGRVYRGLVA